MSEYESILHKIGSFGPYQRRVFILVSMFETPAAWAMLLPIVLHATPDWECPIFGHGNSSTFNLSEASNSSSFTVNECLPDGSQCPGLQFTGPFSSIVSEWQLVCDRKNLTKIITTIQMCGVLLGALITGQLADIFGRRKVLYLTYIFMLVVSLSSAFAPSWQVFAVLRFFIGGSVGGVMVVNFVLPLEFVTPSWRTFCGCVGFWAIGLMTLALWGFLIRDWRTLVIATAVTGVPMLFSWSFVTESPRWLLTKGRVAEAKVEVQRMAAYNKVTLSDEDLEQLDIYTEREKESLIERKKYSYHDIFKTRTMLKNTLIVMYGWFVSSSVYYGLNFNTSNLAGDLYINTFIAGLVEIPALVYVILVNNRLGRRWTIASLMTLAGISCFVILIIDLTGHMESLQVLVIVFAMIGKSGISGGWAAIQVSSAENFPTIVRNLGIGVCSMAARIGGIVAPQINQLNSYSKAMPFTVFGSLALLCGLLVLFLPETAGKPLPDNLIPKKNTGKFQDTELTVSLKNGHASADEEISLNQV
ncbi:organic cation transporter protein-like [Mizuhopecten yessoensis]|uniref:Organic cation transporter-like protein n=1 Tax=Mizuhopecten yessoensis TaxID=6573 RepID=A0A210PMR0_MIZYE|nr:organic cation transporter protein-like [Mizuhopecten yessoensis]OWF37778.1 Organic cation transporter-like protein [Mizuhopecten yessoensis]